MHMCFHNLKKEEALIGVYEMMLDNDMSNVIGDKMIS